MTTRNLGKVKIIHRGAWSSFPRSYRELDIVSHAGTSWICKDPHTSVSTEPPSHSTRDIWGKLANVGGASEGIIGMTINSAGDLLVETG